MRTGCQGPYCHGTGGWCGCNCKCCPPPCCPVIAVYFQCGYPQTPENPEGCVFTEDAPAWENLKLQAEVPKLPEFSNKTIISEDKGFTLGFGDGPCSVPCETVCVEVRCGGFGLPCCCLELLDGKIYSVGNGYVTAPTTVELTECLSGTVYLNGLPPPIFVQDCEEIIVTIVPEYIECCECEQIDIQCSPCPSSTPMAVRKAPLRKRKIDSRTGKTKINPKTGQPIIMLNKAELMKRIMARIKNSNRGKK